MSQVLAAQSQRETKKASQDRDSSHLAVRAMPDHEMPSGLRDNRPTTSFGHEFSQTAVRPGATMVGRDYGAASCPVFPQTCPFGGACHTCPAQVQTKLTVNEPGDKYEQEADRIADLVMRMPEPEIGLQRSCLDCDEELQRQPEEEEEEEELIQTKLSDRPALQRQETLEEDEEEELLQAERHDAQAPSVTGAVASKIQAMKGSGRPLPESERPFFEPRFGYDFGQVRVHTDTRAAGAAHAVRACAFTAGHDVVFGSGQYSPNTNTGRRLLAHELMHVIQQDRGDTQVQRRERRRAGTTDETRWAQAHPEGRVDKISDRHYILWNFSVGKSALKPEFVETLNEIGRRWPILNLADTGRVVVHGHASRSGTEQTNDRLAWRRAIKVKSYLFGLDDNIPWDRISVAAFGESTPRFPSINAGMMARNRRVEIKLEAPYSPTPRPKEEPPKTASRPRPKDNPLKDVWLGVGESHSGDMFVVGAHSAASVVYNLGDEWPNVRWVAVNVSGYKFGLGLGGSVGAAFILVNGVSHVSEFSMLTPGGFDFDLSLGARLKGWLSSLKGIGKVVKTLEDYKKLKYVGEQAIKNRDLAKKGIHAFAVPLGAGLHLWLGYKFGEVQTISHGVLDEKP